MRTLITLVFATALALAVGSCGRKGQPEPPPGADYPRTYPAK